MHCTSDKFTIGRFLVERNSINASPVYQRESAVWSLEKQQLFLDSVFNKFDIPKIYLHDLRGKDARYQFAVIDGKQRLHTLWEFLDNRLKLAGDFKLIDVTTGTKNPPTGGESYKGLSSEWQDLFKSGSLDVVLVQNADVDDIEELFSRLNNGEPLNAAEKRNAYGGDMCGLIRQVAEEPFFKQKVRFGNGRYQHREVAVKFLLIEKTEQGGASASCDLKKRFLDRLVKDNKKMSDAAKQGLLKRVQTQLRAVDRVFSNADALLEKQAAAPLYYLFIKLMDREYGHEFLYSKIRKFLEEFQVRRAKNLELEEEKQDSKLIEFGRLMQQGTNDQNSLVDRVSILRRYFLLDNPDVMLKDKKRLFSSEERHVIFILSGKQCAECKKPLKDVDEMQADHSTQWAFAGKTILTNGRALCEDCNKRLAEKKK